MTAGQAETSVREAIAAGFRHIDSAEIYNNEEGTGKGIKASGIPRSDIFVTTKLFPGAGPSGLPEKDYGQTLEMLKTQLRRLQLDYADLYLIHAPFSALRLEQWRALMELKRLGLTKHIGVSNYSEERIKEILDAGLEKPEVNQIELHPMCTRPRLIAYMKENSIEPVAYSLLAPLSQWRAAEGQGGEVLAEKKEKSQRIIREIAAKRGVSEARLLLRWGLQQGCVVLTRSGSPGRIRENFRLFDFEIPEGDMDRLNSLNQDQAFAWAPSGIDPLESAAPVK